MFGKPIAAWHPFVLPVALVLAGISVSGCMQTTVEHYDACMAEGGSFQAMAACGKARRLAACQDYTGDCSASGTAIMQYADTLALQVRRREITDAEARRRFVEFKTAQMNSDRLVRATAAASAPEVADAAPSGPKVCTAVGSRSAICN